ncbi:MAG: hypothetical protein N2C14_15800 [Planctomycetales bacterium]
MRVSPRPGGLSWFMALCAGSILAVMVASNLAAADPPAKKKPLTPFAVLDTVNSLKKEDVAWRRVAWKTCLLDGLQASRKENKPIVLWIFIDRPIDDERC